MQSWLIGDARITRLVETEDTSITADVMLPQATPENVLPIGWLRPDFIDADGRLITSIFSLLVECHGKRMVIDTCVGNDKERGVPMWHRRQGRFLEELAAAGFDPPSVDYVVCTHLHPDHVGWNTRLVAGEWVPTFPNARYLFSSPDWEWLRQQPASVLGDYCADSVRPVVTAGLADFIKPDHQLTDEIRLESTPGHSPGHLSVRISSAGHHAVVTGDVLHHPCQMARPEWRSPFDFDQEQALQTRRDFLERFCGEPVLVIGSHFATPAAGRIVRDGGAYRLLT